MLVDLNNILFALIIPFSLVFIDVTILAAMELDFFHRNTMRWREIRLPLYIIAFAVGVIFLLPGDYNPPAELIIFVVYPIIFGGIPLVLGYSIITLIVASRRTPDRTIKRHVRLLGFALACYALVLGVAIFTSFIFSPSDIPTTLLDFLGILGSYLIYRAVMSLSPTSHMEKEIVAK